MRDALMQILRDNMKSKEISKDDAICILELFDDECNDTSEFTAYDKAMQDVENAQNGEF